MLARRGEAFRERTDALFLRIPLVGRLADTVGRRPVYLVGAITTASWGFFAFPMMNSGHNVVIMLAIIIGLVFHAFMYATQPAIMSEMFPTRMRYSGVSLGYQVTSIVAGSLAPIIAVKLLDVYGSSVPIAWYLFASAAITFVAVLVARETRGIALESIDVADAKTLATEAELAKVGLK